MPSSWISTRAHPPDGAAPTALRDAVLASLAPDGGLYMPSRIEPLPAAAWWGLRGASLPEIATTLLGAILGDDIPSRELGAMAERAFTFPAPVVRFDDQTSILELFHGPTLAFKDFAAQFMAQLLGFLVAPTKEHPLTVLVATSGDTGGAVAAGFHAVPGFRVVILYPHGRVSALQERQLTTWGDNVAAYAVDGTFDDCQRLVKQAFADQALRARVPLVSCNSINLARWLPQMVYYAAAWAQLTATTPLVFAVPSGNFGNLAAGVLAKRLGLPVGAFIAATNANDAMPRYLASGAYEPRATIATLSNAMDVGAPSNSERLFALYGHDLAAMRAEIYGHTTTDDQTRATMRAAYQQHGAVIDPHTAVALDAWQQLAPTLRGSYPNVHGVVLATAHPAKFIADVEAAIGAPLSLPPALAAIAERPTPRQTLTNDYHRLTATLTVS